METKKMKKTNFEAEQKRILKNWVQLIPPWILTTAHPASSYDQPVLVNRTTMKAYGPSDIMRPFQNWGIAPAASHVARWRYILELEGKALAMANQFVDHWVSQPATVLAQQCDDPAARAEVPDAHPGEPCNTVASAPPHQPSNQS